jgi:uncharacterized protein YkwD
MRNQGKLNARTAAALGRRVCAVVVMLLALGPAVIMTAPSAQAYNNSAAVTNAYEARLVYLVNVQRTRYGRARLALAACPERYAESWANYLAVTGRFYHRNMTSYLNGCKASRVAENISRGNVSADAMVAIWMASPVHRRNILNPLLTKVGTGAVYYRGRWTVTMTFSRP